MQSVIREKASDKLWLGKDYTWSGTGGSRAQVLVLGNVPVRELEIYPGSDPRPAIYPDLAHNCVKFN